jgi:transposase-like protein
MNALPIKREEDEMGNWRRQSQEFKRQVVERRKTSDNIHELARELGIERKPMYTWKYQFEGWPEKNHADYRGSAPDTVEARRENKELKETLGEKAAEVDFFVAALRRVKQDRPTNGANGGRASMPKSGRKSRRKAN